MRYLVDKIELLKDVLKNYRVGTNEYVGAFFCKYCGAELYIEYQYAFTRLSPSTAKKEDQPDEAYARDTEHKARTKYAMFVNDAVCPVCGAQLLREKGYFMPTFHIEELKELLKFYEAKPNSKFPAFDYPHDIDKKFECMALYRKKPEQAEAKQQAEAFVQNSDLPVIGSASHTGSFRTETDNLKKYITNLIRLENNIYSLGQHLHELYYQRLLNNRAIVSENKGPEYILRSELKELHEAYQNAVKAVEDAEGYQPEVYVDYPTKPVKPVLGKAGLFNKKKVLAENETLTGKYQLSLAAYEREVQRCNEEKARLITEKRSGARIEAQKNADTARIAIENAENRLNEKPKELEIRPTPAKAVKEMLDKEIVESEDALKKALAARNELYSLDVIETIPRIV